jgi:LacI family transcriptional regulator
MRGEVLFIRLALPKSRDHDEIAYTRRIVRMADGIVACIGSRYGLDLLRGFGKPFVVINNLMAETGFPQVHSDDAAIGRMAANYFLRNGFSRFAYFGDTSGFGVGRGRAFAETVREAGFECAVCDSADRRTIGEQLAEIKRQQQHSPLAVFACNDGRACSAINYGRASWLRVPQDLAVLGVDNDPWLALQCGIPISSIEPAGYDIGRKAGRLIVKLMRGGDAPGSAILVPPLRLIPRLSTDVAAVSDTQMAEAMRFIRASVDAGISVKDVVAHLKNVPRRTLERRFRRAFGTSLKDAIVSTRHERAKELLIPGNLEVGQVASMLGFSSLSHFCTVFRSAEGVTPKAFQKRLPPP